MRSALSNSIYDKIMSEDQYKDNFVPGENSENSFLGYDRALFIELCNNVLYSDNKQLVANSLDRIFKDFRYYIINGSNVISVSCFSEVILKIIQMQNNNNYESTGEQYNSFIRFIALVRDQEGLNKNMLNNLFKKNSAANLKRYLLYFMTDDSTTSINDEYIRHLLKLYFKDM